MIENKTITVKALQWHPEIDAEEEITVKIERKNTHDNIEQFLENEFKGLKCDKCEESKGTVFAFTNVETTGISLRFKDFCCYEFQDKTHKTLK